MSRNNHAVSSSPAQAALVTLVEEEVETRMRARDPFTALDISNALKNQKFGVRHGEVAAIVRDIHASGAMAHYEYDRRLIDVVTDGGAKKTQAFLYLHDSARERDYTDRNQAALAPVPADQARDLTDAVAANNPVSPLAGLRSNTIDATGRQRRGRRNKRSARRRDGALAIPRSLIAQAGWRVGDVLTLRISTTALEIAAPSGPSTNAAPTSTGKLAVVRVWADLRVRICKTKLRLVAALADPAGSARIGLQNGVLCVEPQTG